MSSSYRRRKQDALQKLRMHKNNTGLLNPLEDYEVKDEGDIYQVVDESDYQELVESRRQREDFVVDDDGLGYYDDGEERLGDEDDTNQPKKRSISNTAALTSAALKKARRTKVLMSSSSASKNKNHKKGDNDDNDNNNDDDDNDETAAVKKNRSMWDFVQRGASASAATTTTTTSSSSSLSLSRSNKSQKGQHPSSSSIPSTADLHSLLAELDTTTTTSSSTRKRRSTFATSTNRSKARAVASARRHLRFSAMSSSSSANHSTRRRSSSSKPRDDSNFNHDNDDNDGDDQYDAGSTWNDDHEDHDDTGQPSGAAGTADAVDEPTEETKTSVVRFAENVGHHQSHTNKDTNARTTESNNKESEEQEVKPKEFQRRRLAKKTTMSAPARKAMEAQQLQLQQQLAKKQEQVKKSTATAASTLHMIDATGASFQPEAIATDESESHSTTAALDATSVAQLESVLLTTKGKGNDDDEAETTYLDMFWMDACERDGEVHLFGKTPLRDAPDTFVSCCVVVKNNLRNLFCLPRRRHTNSKPTESEPTIKNENENDNSDDDGEYESILNVHSEIKSILQPACLPHAAGSAWAGKVVTRQYAFDDATIPRQPTQYYKVVYDAKYPAPFPDVCAKGGKYIDKILNGGATVLETFILKRKLMGPCWIRIQNPSPNKGLLTWCKVECHVTNPKDVTRWDLAQEKGQVTSRPPPPIVAVTLKIKTIVNPKTHKSEVVSVSALCHKKVLLDTASDESTKCMTQLSLIRPLNLNTVHESHGLPQFPRDIDQEIQSQMPQLQRMPNERALLSRLLVQIGLWDPDVLIGHNAWGYDMQVLLTRSTELKVNTWSKFGRRRKTQPPRSLSTDFAVADVLVGRLLCDTYLSAKELLHETTYSLTNLALTQLKTARVDIEPVDIPLWFQTSQTIVQLAKHTLHDAQLVQRLMFKLQIIPLTKQLTCIAGNLWSKTIKGSRADRNEYLLLHEFHQLKILPPEKKFKGKKQHQKQEVHRDEEGNIEPETAPGVTNKAKYSGGLVLEPKKGLYDSFILLLDFNSLYPSIIQEYNLCFTTIDWANFAPGAVTPDTSGNNLPPLPDDAIERGVLPRVIKSLVDRRRTVKNMLKSEQDRDKREELDVRQKALKLTANSMYGCLGFSNSRFYAQPIAALVTAMGRETLQRTVDITQNSIGLEVIYGDTDSIMINTRISDPNELDKVMELGNKVKKEVNRLYKTLELEIDGIFRSMLLLKKKKYAAITVEMTPNGPKYGKERKGLDLVRRDWCVQSKDTGEYVLDQILSGGDTEVVVHNIHEHLEELAKRMRAGDLPLEKYVITKGLSKHPNDYPDGKSQPHVQVAKIMLQNNRPVNMGDHIPYIITAPQADSESASKSPADRARHPDDVARSAGLLKPDVEWYLTQQILPPVTRLCEPVDGTSPGVLAEKLGLDSSKYRNNSGRPSGSDAWEEDNGDLVDFTPSSQLLDEERFKDVEKLQFQCLACGVTSEFPGVFSNRGNADEADLSTRLVCVNLACPHRRYWGHANAADCLARLSNTVAVSIYNKMRVYYQSEMVCDDPTCHSKTRQLSVVGGVCLGRGCSGQMRSVYTERTLHTQLSYLEALFDVEHASKQWEQKKIYGAQKDLIKSISTHDKMVFNQLKLYCSQYLTSSAFNWVDPTFWCKLFGSFQPKIEQF